MIIERIMTSSLLVAHPNTTVTDAQDTMQREKIHHLPIVHAETKKLLGIVSEKDLLYASPSPASTLDVWEMTKLLSRLTVDKVMTKEVVTVTADDIVENAARIMVDRDIGCLPVVDKAGIPIGIITESDLFRIFIDLFGSRERGLRATLRVPEEPGEVEKLARDIAEHGGNIISFGTLPGDGPTNAVCIIKVSGMSRELFLSSVEKHILDVMDIREV
jgi:acetoin utilization protein AcuB